MTGMAYYPPAAPPRGLGAADPPGPILVEVAAPAAQRRATVAARLILAIPHLLILCPLGIAACVVVAIGWLGALATGRLPRFAAAYLSGYLRWYTRAGAYLLLLTDEYPPFAFGDDGYPVRLVVGSGRLNRLTVAFRAVLAFPAVIVSMLLTTGFANVVIFAGWLAALTAGRLPEPLHQAFTAALRYTVRCHGYLYLLTGAYPAGLFGDEPAFPDEAATRWGYGTSTGWYAPPATDPGGTNPGPPLALSPAAKRLLGVMLVLGLLTAAGEGVWVGSRIHAARLRTTEISQLGDAAVQFNADVTWHNAAVTREQAAAGEVTKATEVLSHSNDMLDSALQHALAVTDTCVTLDCFNMAARPVAAAFAAFGRTLRATPVPPGSAAIDKRLIADSADYGEDWTGQSQADTYASYIVFASAGEKAGGRWDSDYSALMTSLHDTGATLDDEAATFTDAAEELNRDAAALSRQAADLHVAISLLTANSAS